MLTMFMELSIVMLTMFVKLISVVMLTTLRNTYG